MNQDKDRHEQEFEQYLEGESSLSGAYRRASAQQPPAHLDEAILAASRREVKARPRFAFSPFASDWHVPLSLAAVLVLSVTVIITMQQEHDESYLKTPALEKSGFVSDQAEVDTASASSEREAYPSEGGFVSEPEAARDSTSGQGKAKSADSASAVIMKREVAPAWKADVGAGSRNIAPPASRADEAILSAPATITPSMNGYAPAPAEIREELEPRRNRIMKEQKNQAARGQKGAMDEGTVKMKKRVLERDSLDMDHASSKDMATAAEEVNAAAAGILAEDDAFHESAEQWLLRINQLWQNGQQARAAEELKLFHHHYPEHEITGSLDRQLIDTLRDAP